MFGFKKNKPENNNPEILENPQILTRKDIDPNQLTLDGIKLNDPIDKISVSEKNKFKYGTHWVGDHEHFSYGADKETKTKVSEFLLRAELLKDLKITSPVKIIKTFGQPEALEKKNRSHYYFYPKQKMVVSWSGNSNKLFGIYIGDSIIQQTTITAFDFLNKYFELKRLEPDLRNWSLSALKYNEPRFYRLKELQSLIRAFDIGTDLKRDFVELNFLLKKRTKADFQAIITDVHNYMANHEHHKKYDMDDFRFEWESRRIISYFLEFSEKAREFLAFNSGWLEAGSISARYLITTTGNALSTFDQKELRRIDDLICSVISPSNQSFTQTELIKNFDYPDVDLEDIDMEHY